MNIVKGKTLTVLAPCCEYDYSHQGRVDVFVRGEDEQKGNHVSIIGDLVNIDRSMEGNPSGRRQGVSISVECEGCGQEHLLCVYQHKGQTIVELV